MVLFLFGRFMCVLCEVIFKFSRFLVIGDMIINYYRNIGKVCYICKGINFFVCVSLSFVIGRLLYLKLFYNLIKLLLSEDYFVLVIILI